MKATCNLSLTLAPSVFLLLSQSEPGGKEDPALSRRPSAALAWRVQVPFATVLSAAGWGTAIGHRQGNRCCMSNPTSFVEKGGFPGKQGETHPFLILGISLAPALSFRELMRVSQPLTLDCVASTPQRKCGRPHHPAVRSGKHAENELGSDSTQNTRPATLRLLQPAAGNPTATSRYRIIGLKRTEVQGRPQCCPIFGTILKHRSPGAASWALNDQIRASGRGH